MPYSLILDVVIAILLVITICYCIVLNKRLGYMRNDKTELEDLAVNFDQSTSRAEESIGELKSTATLLQERVDKASSLRDDLAFLIDRGGAAADRLEETVRTAREEPTAQTLVASRGKSGADKSQKTASDDRRKSRGKASRGLGDVVPGPKSAARAKSDPPQDARSDAERELLRALRSVG